MPIHLSIEARGDHLRFEVTGERVPEKLADEMLQVWRRVAEKSRATGLNRVLGVSRLTGPTSASQFYRIASELPAILGGVTSKVAYVVLGDPDAARRAMFVENVVEARGIRSRVFEDEARALEWLREL